MFSNEANAQSPHLPRRLIAPGEVQTERYMRAVFGTLPDLTADEIDRRVTGRLTRQEVVHRADPRPPHGWALVDEAALRRPAGDVDVMYRQCMHALEISRLPHVSLAVIPCAVGAHIGLSGACDIVERDGVPRVVNLDDLADGRVSEDPALIRQVALRFRSCSMTRGRGAHHLGQRLARAARRDPRLAKAAFLSSAARPARG